MSGDDGEAEELDALLGKIVLGRYRIVRELARGGMGAIYLARSEGAASFIKPVVVKRMLPEFVGDAAAAKMFKREARIMSTLRHPGIVSVFDFGREEQGYLLVMDYVHGFHFGRWSGWVLGQEREVPVGVAVHVVVQVLEALHFAHTLSGPDGEQLDIVHRDVSPSNVLLDVNGHVRLADFGIAQSAADAPDVKTSTRSVKGKFSYMAPEILEGMEPTPGTDAYSAAVVLHEALVGRNEFRTANPSSTIGRVLTYVPTRLDAVRSDVSKELADVIEQALRKDPDERFASAADLARALRRARGMEAEDAGQLLAETFARDFRDPSLAAMYDLPGLDDLERAWRMPSPLVSSSPPGSLDALRDGTERAERRSDEPTTGAKPALTAERAADVLSARPTLAPPHARRAQPVEARPSRAPLAIALLIGIAGIAAVAVAAWWVGRAPEGGPDVVYVEATPAGIEGMGTEPVPATDGTDLVPAIPATDPLRPPDPVPATVETEPVPATGRTTPTRRDPVPAVDGRSPDDREAAAIQRAFAHHTAEIRRCFESAPLDTPHDLVLRFSIDESGAVQRVELTPAAVATTAPGRCVQRIASAIAFPRTSSARSFRIPIEVRPR